MLKAREGHIKNVSEAATAQLSQISQNHAVYEDIVQKLIIQATFQLLESTAFVICRQTDIKVIEVCSMTPKIFDLKNVTW